MQAGGEVGALLQHSVSATLAAAAEAAQALLAQAALLIGTATALVVNLAGQVDAAIALATGILLGLFAFVGFLVALAHDIIIGIGIPTGPGTGSPPIPAQPDTGFPRLPPPLPDESLSLLLPIAAVLQNVRNLKNETENATQQVLFTAIDTVAANANGVQVLLDLTASAGQASSAAGGLLVDSSVASRALVREVANATGNASASLLALTQGMASVLLQAMANLTALALPVLNASLARAGAAVDAAVASGADLAIGVVALVEHLEFSAILLVAVAVRFLVAVADAVSVPAVALGCDGGAMAAFDHLVATNLTLCSVMRILALAGRSAEVLLATLVAIVLEKQGVLSEFLKEVIRA